MDFNLQENYANLMFPFSLQICTMYMYMYIYNGWLFSLVQGFSRFPLTYKYLKAEPRIQVSL